MKMAPQPGLSKGDFYRNQGVRVSCSFFGSVSTLGMRQWLLPSVRASGSRPPGKAAAGPAGRFKPDVSFQNSSSEPLFKSKCLDIFLPLGWPFQCIYIYMYCTPLQSYALTSSKHWPDCARYQVPARRPCSSQVPHVRVHHFHLFQRRRAAPWFVPKAGVEEALRWFESRTLWAGLGWYLPFQSFGFVRLACHYPLSSCCSAEQQLFHTTRLCTVVLNNLLVIGGGGGLAHSTLQPQGISKTVARMNGAPHCLEQGHLWHRSWQFGSSVPSTS